MWKFLSWKKFATHTIPPLQKAKGKYFSLLSFVLYSKRRYMPPKDSLHLHKIQAQYTHDIKDMTFPRSTPQ